MIVHTGLTVPDGKPVFRSHESLQLDFLKSGCEFIISNARYCRNIWMDMRCQIGMTKLRCDRWAGAIERGLDKSKHHKFLIEKNTEGWGLVFRKMILARFF